ncbi:serine hydrolase [Bdellovibrio sp. 22V]|uniref:serine hydrolase n=1 Tax=Bdellovibrio sp. 22V TaxID=3044166 RepID=UPI0025426ECF|nr:serine hydrolase [Bdellovibrio sp. 22V]WII71063.1 serine hydrolase [Bdellovibrio sp. 22V]
MKYILLFSVILIGACATKPSETTPRLSPLGKLDLIAQDYLAKTGVPGMAIAVVKNDRVVFAKGYGVRELGKPETVDTETVFQLASMSKPLGASAIAAAVSAGKLKWQDPIQKHLPAFKLADSKISQEVTIEDMYSHRSGLPGGAGDILEILGYERADVLSKLRYENLHEFRGIFAYSNFGMTAGGEAAAKASGQKWEDLTQMKVFAPLGMKSTSSRYADFIEKKNRATLHKKIEDTWQVSPFKRNPDAQSPAGGISSNVQDLAQWMRMILASGKYDDREIIKADVLNDMFLPRIEDKTESSAKHKNYYSLGFFSTTDSQQRIRLSHSGIFDAGASTTVVLVPDIKIGIVVLTNGEPVGLPEAVAASFLDEVFEKKQTQDWLSYYHELHAAKPIPPVADDRKKPIKSSKPASAYVGIYKNKYYGDARITFSGKGLVLTLGPRKLKFPLTSWEKDTFLMTHVNEFTMAGKNSLVHFGVGPNGKATSFKVDLLDGNVQGTFTRK